MHKKKSASGRGAHTNLETLDTWRRMAHAVIDEVFDSIHDAERVIAAARDALAVSQPPRNGKIDVRWWHIKSRKETSITHPVLVKWVNKGNTGTRYPKPVKRLEIARDGTAAINADQVAELVKIVKSFIQTRSDLLSKVTTLRRSLLLRARRASLSAENALVAVERLHQKSIDNLLERGYEICIEQNSKYDESADALADNHAPGGKKAVGKHGPIRLRS